MRHHSKIAALHLLLPLALCAKVTVVDSVDVEDQADKKSLSMQAGALPAQTYVITQDDIRKMNVNHYLDLFRKLPGMITGHSGQGAIADAFGMRGFQGGHGGQTGVWVDGVPINSPHHPHTHGFNDFDWVTPEMIEKIEVIKGPTSALYGNFAQAGIINIVTKKSVSGSSVGVSAGAYNMGQAYGVIGSRSWQPVTPFIIFETKHFEGYRANQDYGRFNFFNKFSFEVPGGLLSVRAHYVDRKWNAPGYLYRPEVVDGSLDPRTSAFGTDGGDSKYYNAVINYSPKAGEKGLHVTLYGVHEELNRFQTGGQLRAAAASPSQIQEHNDRNFFGGSVLYNMIQGELWSVAAGLEGRFDDGEAQRFRTVDRVVDQANPFVRNWGIQEISSGAFAQAQYRPIRMLKLVAGGRLDYFHADVDNRLVSEHSGEGDFLVPSPKAGLVLSPLPMLDVFANYGRGFRTPSAGEMSPESRNNRSANFEVDPTFFHSTDLGINMRLLDMAILSSCGYFQKSEGEIRIDQDTYEAVNVGETERMGIENEFRVFLPAGFGLYGGYEYMHARAVNPPAPAAGQPSAKHLSGVAENYFNAGVEYVALVGGRPLDLDLHWQLIGEAPGNATNTYVRKAVSRFNLKAAYSLARVGITAGATWIPDGEVVNEQSSEFSIDPKPEWDFNLGARYNF